jgi:protein tyrosine/serine phosphatase
MQLRIPVISTILIFGLSSLAFAASVPGINNFQEVDQQVYRGAQPTTEGFNNLAKLGVKVILDLREPGARALSEERIVTAAGMHYVNVPMSGLTPPTKAQTDTILTLLEDRAAGPVFVHCRRGADRTGAVIGAYRIDHDGWDNSRALRDALSSGMSWFQFPRQSYIRTFQPRTKESVNTMAAVNSGN